tara:strand:+ start:66623 stop:69601 length:2979 start_codon:yes stop_codon:yes gene_type:complete
LFASVFFYFVEGVPLDSYWQQKVDYSMEVTLHNNARQLACRSVISYVNNSPDTLDRVYLHLYPNAFQKGSVKSREYNNNYGRESRGKYFKDELSGYSSEIKVHDFNISKKGQPVLKDYSINDTILKGILNRKLSPGEVLRIDISWTHHVGVMIERAGYYGGQYNMAQWYPKVAVYDEDGWHADVFHAEGEFYGEFGDFKVKFDLPKSFIIGASGIVTDGDPGWKDVEVDTSIEFNIWSSIFDSSYVSMDSTQRRQVTFLARKVHDFAWVAGPDLRYENGKFNNVNVHVLYHKKRGYSWSKIVLRRTIRSLEWLDQRFGSYLYPQVTVVDRIKGGGMEYPMLVMNGSERESLILHEIGHIYFYGVLANNERDEPWLDEGFTTNQTRNYMMNRYGDHGYDTSRFEGHTHFSKYIPLNNALHSSQWSAINFMRSGHDEPLGLPSHLFSSGISYRQNAYTKPALMLNELNYILGDSIYLKCIRNYYQEWKYRHVNELSFVSSVEKTTGKQLDWFFNSWIKTTKQLDYEIYSFRKIKKENCWHVELELRTNGQRFMPMLIKTEFDDGTSDLRWWTNHLWRYHDKIVFSVDKKPTVVSIDPSVQTMDLDYRNNTTKMKTYHMLDLPGNGFNPRDKYVIKWKPSMYFNSTTNVFAPGISLKKLYGPYEQTKFDFNYALGSKKYYWNFNAWRQAVHVLPRTKFYFWTFKKPGVSEFGFRITKKWNQVYGRTPLNTFTFGAYLQPEYDPTRAVPLGFDCNGKLGVGFLTWDGKLGSTKIGINASSSINGYSSWKFSRLTAIGNLNKVWKEKILFPELNSGKSLKSHLELNNRMIIGKIWANKSFIPSQEAYNIGGNSPNDILRKSYLIDQFYGYQSLYQHYHMPGEGNLRGFITSEEDQADALIAFSSEFLTKININAVTSYLELACFFDGGYFNNMATSGEENSFSRTLADAGFGFRFENYTFPNRPYYFRIDFPFLIYRNSEGFTFNKSKWIISFEKSL